MNRKNRVQEYLLQSAEIQKGVANECAESILLAAELITACFQSGGKVLLCGNGGSAADCQHMATEFVSRLRKDFERPGLPAIALTTDTSYITAFANDFGFDGMFERQVQALGNPGDILIAISTSGESVNVIRAVKAAWASDIYPIVITGRGGQLGEMGKVSISVPSNDTQYVQESHLAIEHILCELVEKDMFGLGESGRAQTL